MEEKKFNFNNNDFFEQIYEKNKSVNNLWEEKLENNIEKPIYSQGNEISAKSYADKISQKYILPLATEIGSKAPVKIPKIGKYPIPEVQDLPPFPEIKTFFTPSVVTPHVDALEPTLLVETPAPVKKPSHYKKPKTYIGQVLEEDSLAVDHLKLTHEQSRQARFLAKANPQNLMDVEQAKTLGISISSLETAFGMRNLFESHMELKYKDIVNSSSWSDLKPRMEYLFIRFLVQHAALQKTEIGKILLDERIKITESVTDQAMLAFNTARKTQLPLYEKLFDDLNKLRQNGRNPLEVYLGRDGIYAFIGRKAQDIAQRRKLGWKKRKEAKENGEVLGPRIKYLVYPRLFRDTLSHELKKAYLEDSDVTRDTDPIFYDTGFVGTIPEQILSILGFSGVEIETRMKLLSASKPGRRVNGISEYQRSQIVNEIEYSAKSEEVSVGLVQDQKSGKLRHVAFATSPQEQYMYEMIRLAISDYFFHKNK